MHRLHIDEPLVGVNGGFPLLERCCDAASAVASITERTRGGWLHRLCEAIELTSPHHVGVLAIEVRVVGGVTGWQTLETAIAGIADPDAAQKLIEEAWDGLPDDDLAGPAGQRRPSPDQFVGARRAMASDELWARSAYRAHRARSGMHDFARALLPFKGEDGPRALIVQVDGLAEGWSPEPITVRSLGALSNHIVRSYEAAFIEPILHRLSLLDRLTGAQREVAPLLATPMTEGEIAEAVNRSRHTIHDHTKSVYRAWGVRNRIALRDLWNQRGLGEIIGVE